MRHGKCREKNTAVLGITVMGHLLLPQTAGLAAVVAGNLGGHGDDPLSWR